MELPFTVVFEPPSRTELRALLRMRGTWVAGLIVALAIGTVLVHSTVSRADAGAGGGRLPLQVTSRPAGAAVWLDGRELGRTPAQAYVEPGAHNVVLKASGAVDAHYAVQVSGEAGAVERAEGEAVKRGQGAALNVVLWRRQPVLRRLRPSLPGAMLSDVRFLDDGQLGLSLTLPPGRELQAWRLDPDSGVLQSVLTDVAGSRLALSSDGRAVAYVGADVGPPRAGSGLDATHTAGASVVWLVADPASGSPTAGQLQARASAPTHGWRAPLEPGEQLVDASWSPRAERVLAVSVLPLAGGALRSRLWLVEADGVQARPVLSLPSGMLPGSEVWSPDGQHIAFVARAAEVNAVCLLGLDGSFRYLADLDPSPTPPLPYPALSWSADGQRLLFVAPHQRPPGAGFGWLQPDARRALHVANLGDSSVVALGDTDATLAVWRQDGQVLGIARTGPDAPLSLRLLASEGRGQPLVEVPLRPPDSFAAAWDLERARLLVASRNTAGGVDYWLAHLGLEGAS